DSLGFTWIATNFGLNRYDGQHMDVLTRETFHISSNTMFALYLDVHQKLWLIHQEVRSAPINAIDVIDPISFKVQSIQDYITGDLPFLLSDIVEIIADSLNQILLNVKNTEIYRYDGNTFKHIIHLPESKEVYKIGLCRNFVFTLPYFGDSIDAWTIDGQWVSRHVTPKLKDRTDHQYYWKPEGAINENQIIFSTYLPLIPGALPVPGQFYHAIVDTNGFATVEPSPLQQSASIWNFNPFQKRLWMHNDSLCFSFDPVHGIADPPIRIPAYGSRLIQSDRLGYVWVGTDNGILLASKRPKYFKSFLTDQPIAVSCRGMTEDKLGNFHVFSHIGEYIFSPGALDHHQPPSHIQKVALAVTCDRDGIIWTSEESPNLRRYNPYTGDWKKYNLLDSTLPYFAGWAIQQISSGLILQGTSQGLWIKDPHDDNDPVQFTKYNEYDVLAHSTIYNILETAEGIWLSSDNGLFLVDLDKGVLEQVNEKKSHLPNNNILFLHKDDDGIFWIASRGGGLIRWDRSTMTFRSYTVNEGLSHNVIYAIYEDKFGFLWMPSDYGLMRFEKSTGICRTFLRPEGIPHEEFNRTSYYKDNKDNFYFGGLNGFIRFNPADFTQVKSVTLPVRLTKFETINENTGEVQDLSYDATFSKTINLKHEVSSFILHYAILDYDDPHLKRYAYKIDGLNNNWTYLTESFIRINGLKGGDYEIRIKGQSAAGQWSENELIIPLHIEKTFLARWYAIAGMILLAGGIVLIIFRRRSALQKAKLETEMAVSQQLRQVDKLKDQFLANTSHELRTPLNGIVGLSETLLEKTQTPEDKEDLELIIASGRRLSTLVNDILDFSRLKEHDLELNLKPVDVHTIADLCLRINRHLIKDKKIVLENKIPTNTPYCLADENRLQQVFQNLVANAIKFTKAGSIVLDAKEKNGMLMISVSDTGIGIEKEKQDIIFKEFEQADGSVGREFGGTGLGLSISKYLVELHGGTIGVESSPGVGSTFSFTLPIAPKSPEGDFVLESRFAPKSTIGDFKPDLQDMKSPIGDLGAKRKVDLGAKHILVVDDDPVNLKVFKNQLEHAGFNVTLANDGTEALSLLESGNKYHLVLLDVMMPKISGYEVCQKIREKHLSAELPVIMVTAKNQVVDLVEGFDVGANDYIVKPFSKDELLARVKAQIENYQIHEATNRFVPHEFIKSLGHTSIMDLHRGDMVEQNVHVMFSDIRDYTSLAEDMTPSENFKFVNKLAGKVGPIVKSNHGMINQYLGDTIMMLFLQKADDGVQAGIDILRMIEDFNKKRIEKNRKPIHIGVGLHSGPLMMGIIGDSMRTDAAVISDTVNTASRMEGLTKHFNVNFILSGDTLQKMEDPARFNLRHLGKVQAKGKHQSIDVYECFDGDSAEQVRLKKASLSLFHAGLDAYFAKDMNAAQDCFDQVYQANRVDRTAFGFLHRIHNFQMNGLPENWNGVEVMQNK
ncbi:MAG TPA: response regulator, partial [Saprospiraceae bacterium]|nr:response regulator [Saprospiraceae bacterium]